MRFMSRKWWAAKFRRWASALDPAPPFASDVTLALVRRAETLADGTSGEYKRHWVYGQLIRTYPTTPRHHLGLWIEEAVAVMKRE